MKFSRTAQTGFLVFGNGSAALASLLIAMVLSRLLTKEDYATFRQTFLTYQFLAPLLGLGLPAAILYFLPKAPDRARSTISEILFLTCLTGLLFAAFFLLGGSHLVARLFNNPSLENTLLWFAFFPLLFLPIQILKPVLVAQQRSPIVAGFSLAESGIRVLAVVIPVVWIASHPTLAVQGLLAGAGIVLLPALFLMYRSTPRERVAVSGVHMKTLLAYSLPLSVGVVIGTLNKNMDKVLVSAFSEPAVFAVFVNGAMEIPFIGIITGSAASVMIPDLARYYQEGRFQEAMNLFKRSAVKCGSILIPLGGFLFLMAPELMVLLYGEDFRDAAIYFRLYLLLLPFRVVMYGALFQAAGRTDLVLLRAGINLILNFAVSLGLILLLGPIGAVLGSLVSLICFVIPYCLVTCSRMYFIRIREVLPYRKLGIMILATSLAVIFGIGMAENVAVSGWISLVIKTTGYFLICLISVRLFIYIFPKKINHFLNSKISTLKTNEL